jgi:cyclophilin family peptidyl-prolyl cis-trans isomerase
VAADRRLLVRLAAAPALALAVAALAGCGGGADEGAAPETQAAASSGATCEDVAAPSAREPETLDAPTEPLDADTAYSLVFHTSCGDFTVALDLQSAPKTAASLVELARDGYFDETIFHRIVPGFVIQGGDPTQSGSGGPGYSTVDEPAATATYTKGVVAMAKTAAEPRGTSGSQFFVVTADDAMLPADYAIVGEVTDGLDVVELIGTLGDPATEQPLQPVVVDSVEVGED